MRAAQLGIALKTSEVTVISESDVRGLLGTDEGVSAGLVGPRMVVALSRAQWVIESLGARRPWSPKTMANPRVKASGQGGQR